MIFSNKLKLLINNNITSSFHRKKTFFRNFSASYFLNSKADLSKKSIDRKEIENFERLSQKWWDENGEFKILHMMNHLRIPFVRDALYQGRENFKPLKGLKIIDVGCGGGILAEPLARLGADVLGLDAGFENIETAKVHRDKDKDLQNLDYVCQTVEDFADEEKNKVAFDALVMSEIVEHVNDVPHFVSTACSLIKPGGSIFITTINKTRLSYLVAIFLAEKVFKFVPDGIHEWEKFVSPQQLIQILNQMNLKTQQLQGMMFNPLTNKWFWTKNKGVNYALHAIKYSK